MKKDLSSPKTLAVAASVITLRNSLLDELASGVNVDTCVAYVPMKLPTKSAEVVSTLMSCDTGVGLYVLTFIFMVGLDSLYDDFNLDTLEGVRNLKDALYKCVVELHKDNVNDKLH